MSEARIACAERLIGRYLERTGVESGDVVRSARRYLWTDAYAVLALLALHRFEPKAGHLVRAERLAELVHRTLGRHRADDTRRGWISGLDERTGTLHPTAGGLRIGKPLPERLEGEPMSERLEWERDGQYFHYLVKWMTALDRLARAAFEPRWNAHAIELAKRAHDAFLAPREPGRPRRMHWKMSIDLSRPLVASMGHHDPLDGLVTALRLQATARDFGADDATMEALVADYRVICEDVAQWGTGDALGIGGLLSALDECIDLVATGRMAFDPLILRVAAGAGESLASWSEQGELASHPESRLAFREVGLAIGVRAARRMCEAVDRHRARFGEAVERAILRAHLEDVARRGGLADRIEAAWIAPSAQAARSWTMHEDINSVMLAASLLAGAGEPGATDASDPAYADFMRAVNSALLRTPSFK